MGFLMSFFRRSPVDRPRLMHGYTFTERVRKVLAMAREEAARLHHECVGTEHILLGLIREGEGVAAAVLQNLNVDLDEIQQKIEDTVKQGKAAQATGPDLPYTSRAKRVLELSLAESGALDHRYVGTEHLLLGLVREEKGIAAQVLTDTGVNLEAARAETLRLLGTPSAGARAAPRQHSTPPPPAVAGIVPTIAAAQETQAWERLRHALDVTARLGGTPAMTLEADGSLTVPLGPDLVISVVLPTDARVRHRSG